MAEKSKELWEYLLEVRCEALGRFLDLRGAIADTIRSKVGLAYWSIGDNRVDFRRVEESDRESAFVSHRNFGYSLLNPDSPTHFQDRAAKFVRELVKIPGYVLTPVTRIGLRIKSVSPFDGEFSSLKKRIIEKISPPNEFTKLLKGDLDDIGFTYELARGTLRTKATVGPVDRRDMARLFPREFFADEEILPKTGVFLDTDYSKENLGQVNEGVLIDFMSGQGKERQELTAAMHGLLLG